LKSAPSVTRLMAIFEHYDNRAHAGFPPELFGAGLISARQIFDILIRSGFWECRQLCRDYVLCDCRRERPRLLMFLRLLRITNRLINGSRFLPRTASLACHVGKRPQREAATGAVFSSDALRGNSNTRPLLPSVTVGFRSNPYSFRGNRMLDSHRPEQSLTVHLVTGGARLCSIL